LPLGNSCQIQPACFVYVADVRKTTDDDVAVQVDPRTTLVFKLCVRCKKNPKYKGSNTDHNLDEMYIDHNGMNNNLYDSFFILIVLYVTKYISIY